jgi:GT2 family glycosyltransferase
MDGRWEHSAVSRVRDEFDCGCRVPDVYEAHENPRVCAVVQSFNHVHNVPMIARALIDNPGIDEIVICEDGSSDGSLDAWTEALHGLKHFVVVSNNLHEVRCYNRAMRISSAEYFVFLQDDDLPLTGVKNAGEKSAAASRDAGEIAAAEAADDGANWVSEALDLFDADPMLGILSGFIGQMWTEGTGYEFGEQQSDHGGLHKGSTRRIPFVSPHTGRPFMYVECGWIAPLFVRAAVLRRVGGLDVELFNVGEPGMWQDCVLSYAAWSAGWRVGVYDAMFRRGIGGHGSTSTPKKAALRNTMWLKVKDTVDARFERNYVRDVALKINNQTLKWRYSTSAAVGAVARPQK